MNPIDLNAYFAAKLAADEKLLAIKEANDRKITELQAQVNPQGLSPAAAAIDAQRKAYEASLIGQLGIPADSPVGDAANLGASLVSGVSRVAGQVASAVPGVVAAGQDLGVFGTKHVSAAESRALANTITDKTDLSRIVDPTNRQALQKDLGQDFAKAYAQATSGDTTETVKGVGNLLFNAVKALGTNPVAVAEYVTENIPQVGIAALPGGAALMAASNIGYATDLYNQGIATYQKANGGAMPPDDVLRSMALKAASAGAAEQVGEVFTFGATGIGKLTKAGQAAAKAAEETAEQITKRGFKEALKNISKATVTGAAAEAPTEGYQTYIEGDLQGKPATPLDIYTGAVIGGAAGGVIAGGGRTLAEAVGATPEKAKAKADEAKAAVKAVTELDAAIASGDVSGFTDPAKPSYAPDQALAALFGHSQKADTTTEQKTANLAKADEIITGLQERRDNVQSVLDMSTVEGTQKLITGLNAQLNDPEVSPETKAALEPMLAEYQANLAELQAKPADPKDIQKAETSLSKLDRQLAETKKNRDALSSLVTGAVDTDALVDQVNNAPDAEQGTAAANRVISLAMDSPGQLSPEVAKQLADNTANALTAEQRQYLRAFSEARIAANELRDMTGVRREILYGSKQNMGIADHRKAITAALNTGNAEKSADAILKLRRFSIDHARKAAAAQEAEPDKAQIVRTEDGKWIVNKGARLSTPELRANGGLQINSPVLVGNIAAEARALKTAFQEMKAAYDLKFKGGSNVQNTSQQGPGTQTQRQASGVSDPVQAGASDPAVEPQSVPGEIPGAATQVTEVAEVAEVTSGASGSSVIAESTQSPAATQGTKENTTTSGAEPQSANKSPVSPDVVDTVNPELTDSTNVVEESDPAVETPQLGTLIAIGQQAGPSADFKQRRFGDFFKQSLKRDTDATARPLVQVKDFLNTLRTSTLNALPFLKSTELNDKQQKVLAVFIKAADAWDATIRGNLFLGDTKTKQELYQYNDLMQMLVQQNADGSLDLESNVKTAISYALFSWIAEQSTRPLINTKEEINAILQRDEHTFVTSEEANVLAHVGIRQNVVVNALGQRIVDALGLQALPNVPRDRMPALVAGLGAHAFKLAMDKGLVQRTTVPSDVMQDLGLPVKDNVDNFFIKLAFKDGKPVPVNESIVGAMKGTGSVLDKLFSVEPGMKEPSFEPIPFDQERAQNSDSKVPEVLAEIMKAENSTPFKVRQDMWFLVQQMPADVMLEIAGYTDASKQHWEVRDNIQAANDSLRRELENAKDFFGQMDADGNLEADLYFDHVVWKQQRVGIGSNVINPQSSKIHRHMLFRQAWDTTIDLTNEQQVNDFRLLLAESFKGNLDAIFDEQAESQQQRDKAKALNQAVRVLQQTLEGQPMTLPMAEQLAAGVKAGGKKMQTLDGLMAMAQSAFAQANGQTSFQTQLLGEVDGVTNGPMLSHLALGAGSSGTALYGLLNRGGFYEQGSQFDHVGNWKKASANHTDLYETTIKHVVAGVQALIQSGVTLKKKLVWSGPQVEEITNAIYAFTGDLMKDSAVTAEGRNIIKTPLTAMVFGSQLDTAVAGMADNFIESIYAAIADVKAGKRDRVELIKSLNVLLKQSKLKQISETTSTDVLLDQWHLDNTELHEVTKLFTSTIGVAVKSTMEADFAAFIERRRQLNETAAVSFHIYNSVYTAMREQMVAELVKSGDIATTSKGVPIHDLTSAQEADLRKRVAKVLPVLHTEFSKASKSGLGSGLRIAKSDRKLSQNDVYGNEVKFAKNFPDVKADPNKKSHTTKVHGYDRVMSSPGVAMTPMSIHSLDSFISHTAVKLSNMGVLNVHDAHGAGAANLMQVGQNLNKTTWDALLSYSPATEMANALSRTISGLAELARQGQLPATALKRLMAEMDKLGQKHELTGPEMLQVALQQARSNAYYADQVKLEAMSQMGAVDQYSLEGGSYKVTNADRAMAQEKLDALTDQLTAKEKADLEVVMNAVEAGPAQQAPADTGIVVEEAVEEIVAAPPPVSEEFGGDNSDATLVDSTVLELPQTHALQLLEQVRYDSSLNDLQAPLRSIYELMLMEGKQVKDAILEVIPDQARAASLVQLLSDRYNAIPQAVWWGRGTPVIQPHPKLVEFFGANPGANAGRVMEGLFRLYTNDTTLPNREFNIALLKQVFKLVDKNMPIMYITPATTKDMVITVPANSSSGWFAFDTAGAEAIYVLSADFRASNLQPETLVHELVHAAVAQTVDAEMEKRKADPKYTSPVLALVDDLEALRTKAHAEVLARIAAETNIIKRDQLQGYLRGTANVQELIAWGMTNQGFQQDILSQITLQSKTRKEPAVTGFKLFVETLVGIFFKDSNKSKQAITVNGMTTLINNVAGLMNIVRQQTSVSPDPSGRAVALPMESSIVAQTNTYSTIDIHNALNDGTVDPAFQDHLGLLLTSLVEKLHGSFGSFKAELMDKQALTPMDVWTKALDTDKAPFASKIIGSPFNVSQQELYAIEQVESTVLAAISGSESRTKMAYKALSDLYTEAQDSVRPQDFHDGDWATASPDEKALAKAKLDFVFKLDSSTTVAGRSDYLARFAALGLAHQQFNRILQTPTAVNPKRIRDGKTIADKLMTMFGNILEFFQEKYTHTFRGQPADAKLLALVEQLVDIEAKNRTILSQQNNRAQDLMESAEAGVKKVTEGLREAAVAAANSSFLRNSGNTFVRAVGSVSRTVAGGRVDQLMENLADMRDRNFKGRHGVVAGLFDAVRGTKQAMSTLLLAGKYNEKMRQEVIANTTKSSLTMFKDNGKSVTKKQRNALTKVFLRTGAHVLLPHLSMADLQNVLANPGALATEIAKFESQITGPNRGFYVEQTRGLAYYLAKGEVTIPMLLMNGHNIAKMLGTGITVDRPTASAMEDLITPLIALYAIKYTDQSQIREALDTLRTENQRAGENGVEFILQLAQRFQEESRQRLFDSDPSLMMHGYTPEIFNPFIEAVTANESEGYELMKLGYVQTSEVKPDPNDPNQEKRYLYVLRGAGLPPRVTGAISNTGRQAKGSHTHSGFLNTLTQGGAANAATNVGIMTARKPLLQKSLAHGLAFDPRQAKTRYMAPVVNNKGDIVNWRYLMKEDTKDQLLERDNRFDRILGALAGAIYDKPKSQEQNLMVIEVLRGQWESEFAKNSARYMAVGPGSSDPVVQEVWSLLPDHTKKAVRDIWGDQQLMVRSEDFYTIFGAQKLSAATMFKKANKERQEAAQQGVNLKVRNLTEIDGWEKLVVGTSETLLTQYARLTKGMNQKDAEDYAQKAAVLVMKGERAWREIVHEAKDNIVVKSGVVLLGNIWSNFTLLHLDGVTFKDMLHHHLVAMKGALSYQADTDELAHLKLLLSTGQTASKTTEIRRKIIRLEDSIARNPVTELVEAGLMPTIVEDVEMVDDVFSYKSQLAQNIAGLTSKLNPKILGAAKQVYMTHDTGLYQGLARITQLSDFLARYTLYQHTTTRKKDPLSKKDAILNASESFINYDIPMQPGLQYLDDMGVVMFTKYFLRIQKVLMKTMLEHPARVMSLVLLDHLFGMGPIVLDGSAMTRIGNNPIEDGAFKWAGTLDDLLTTRTGLALIK